MPDTIARLRFLSAARDMSLGELIDDVVLRGSTLFGPTQGTSPDVGATSESPAPPAGDSPTAKILRDGKASEKT